MPSVLWGDIWTSDITSDLYSGQCFCKTELSTVRVLTDACCILFSRPPPGITERSVSLLGVYGLCLFVATVRKCKCSCVWSANILICNQLSSIWISLQMFMYSVNVSLLTVRESLGAFVCWHIDARVYFLRPNFTLWIDRCSRIFRIMKLPLKQHSVSVSVCFVAAQVPPSLSICLCSHRLSLILPRAEINKMMVR